MTASRRGAGNWLTLDVVEEAGDWSLFGPTGDLVAAAGAALARHERFRDAYPAEACVALSDDTAVRRLNARYRGKDMATNVLSFPARTVVPGAPPAGNRGDATSLGDIVLAQEVVAREAALNGNPPAHHLQHLVVHGLLHLLGFAHESDKQAREMEGLEVEILASLGIGDPYSEPGISAMNSVGASQGRPDTRRIAGRR